MEPKFLVFKRVLLKNGSVVKLTEETSTHITGQVEGDVFYVFLPKTYIKKSLPDGRVRLAN